MQFIDKLAKFFEPEELGYQGIFEILIQFHIICGAISLLAGTAIIVLSKGNERHRKIGRVYIWVMMANFMVGVPLSSLAQLYVQEPLDWMTGVGSMLVGAFVWSGYRMIQRGNTEIKWHDKAALWLVIGTAGLYFMLAILMVAGTSVFGMMALHIQTAEQFLPSDNRMYIMELSPVLVATSGGTIFSIILAESFVTPLFFALVCSWVAIEDWRRIYGGKSLPRPKVIRQHFFRMLMAFNASLSAVLLNGGWVSFNTCWLAPGLAMLGLYFYFRFFGTRKRARKAKPTSSVLA